ncbi:hypothetical protein [Fischerella thermalis]|nr:hypothetical protein [Fischerella thermalis]
MLLTPFSVGGEGGGFLSRKGTRRYAECDRSAKIGNDANVQMSLVKA